MGKTLALFAALAWLTVGGVAADQRGAFPAHSMSCTTATNISLTFLAGPLNYQGVNPTVQCMLPEPSAFGALD
jgi:hypothetical protein